jgi:hypothetical protein
MRIDKGVVGCLGACYLMALFFLAAAWFGPFWGFGNWHGLSVLFGSDLVYTTGVVIRNDIGGTSSHRNVTPVVEYAVGNHRERFYGEGGNTREFEKGEQVPVAYRRGDLSTAHIRSFSEEFAVPLLLILFALPFVAMALWGTYVNLPGQRAAREKSLIVPAGGK